MTDPHEEIILDQEDINANNIDTNKGDILQNRIMIVSLFVLLLAFNIGSIIVLEHDIHDCEDRLYNHIVSTDTNSLAQD